MIKYFPYLKKLQEVGEKTNKYADIFGEIGERNISNIDGLKKKKEDYRLANLGYKECKEELEALNPPSEITREHKQIIEGYQSMVDGVYILYSSFDLNTGTVDEHSIKLGMQKLSEAEVSVKHATDNIVKKIQSI
ncbi:hypothetical protein [Lysinibacillus boronitolerans]|uniref:hypothetical protein n=1 Tax=Lysinibacillus boronitolerans TaxID=309788 RepID=UPI003851C5EE